MMTMKVETGRLCQLLLDLHGGIEFAMAIVVRSWR